MSKTLPELVEDLRILMMDPPWSQFVGLLRMVDSMAESPELERLTNDELRAFKGFRITMHRAATMEADMMLTHVAAHWLGTAAQAVSKLPIGDAAVKTMADMMGSYPSDTASYGTLT
jgi:hypothetical protein